jgi:hypothetical protein
MKTIKPKDGDHREITKFLLFPKRFNGAWFWLETVTIRQMYLYLFGGALWRWCDICVIDKESGKEYFKI